MLKWTKVDGDTLSVEQKEHIHSQVLCAHSTDYQMKY